MPTSNLPAGAWLSSSVRGDSSLSSFGTVLNPPRPRRPGNSVGENPDRPGGKSAGENPPRPGGGRSADLNPPRPAGGRSAANPAELDLASPWPWDGVDPDWTYQSREALLSVALQKSAIKTSRPGDTGAHAVGNAQGRRPARGDVKEIWWQQPQFRVTTVVAELMSQFVARDGKLYALQSVARGPRNRFQLIEQLDVLPAHWPLDELIQVDKVVRAAVEREDRLPEILTQAENLNPFFESVIGFEFARAPALDEALRAAQELSLHLVMALKHQIARPRPGEVSSLVTPVIATPGHASLPSGHATVAALLSSLLSSFMQLQPKDPRRLRLDRLARRIAHNRVVAGVHYPVDSLAGYRLGMALAKALVELASGKQVAAPPKQDAQSRYDKNSLVLPEFAEAPESVHTITTVLKAGNPWTELAQTAVREFRRLQLDPAAEGQ